METLSTPLTTQTTAAQSGWAELYDIYLKSAITTPWGTLSILRLTNLPGGANFFTPKLSPESAGTQGNAQSYSFWPIQRATVRGDAKSANDKIQITASNVTTEWAAMIAAIDWYDTPIVIRKISTTITTPTADDCAIIWSGQVDSAKLTETQILFECSSDLAALQVIAPRENMHTNCRFQWGDDLCTAWRYRSDNYKSKTVGAGSSDTVVKSADLTEDTSSAASYGTDLVNALADTAITASSQGSVGGTFAVACQSSPFSWAPGLVFTSAAVLSFGTLVVFSGTALPGGIVAGVWYPVTHYTWAGWSGYLVWDPTGSTQMPWVSAGTNVSITSEGGACAEVKSSKSTYWSAIDPATWGTASNGFYTIPDAQAGLKNMGLKPWITFDFGSAKTPRVWRIASAPLPQLERLARLLYLGYSTDGIYFTFHRYFEIPPIGGILYDCLTPSAPSARYWSISVRTQWGAGFKKELLAKVLAYEDSRHWWAWGRITFASNTATVALRNISRRVRESYAGEVHVPKLPAIPAAGDTFIIERGCPRTFNACAERLNTDNFGGFTDLPFQSIIR